MKKKIIALMMLSQTSMMFAQTAANVSKQSYGVELSLKDGAKMKVEMVRPDIVRVRHSAQGKIIDANLTNVCVDHNEPRKFSVIGKKSNNVYTMTSDSLKVEINLESGAISYFDKKTNALIAKEKSTTPHYYEKVVTENVTYDEASRRTVHTADGDKEVRDVLRRDTVGVTWKYRLNWQYKQDEAIYGLGSHIENVMNLRGSKIYLCQHNLKAMVPVLNSTAGYGLLINAGSEMIYDDDVIEIGATQQLDYYFMKGKTMDKTVACYRWLTGEAPMMPRYLFGYTQSKERYVSSQDLISTLSRLRSEHIPVDMIVQDWNYWENGSWGHMKMNTRDFPDKKLLSKTIHDMNAKLMISIWPTFSNSPQADDFIKRGMMINGTNAYDAFSEKARDLYWEYANNEFFSNDFDAWWCDSSEPLDADWSNQGQGYDKDSHERRFELCSKKLGDALGHERSQLYSLYHSMGIYENQRKVTDRKRVVNLTRSSYAGQQRYATITWNGDTYAAWDSFKQMIPAGLNFMATGCPYWSIDIGAFFTKKGWAWFYNGDYPKGVDDMGYRELYTRMLQYATFLPVMRSHGSDTPREPWRFGKQGEPFYDSILKFIRLRYALLPYTYSLSSRVSNEAYTMTRALAFDFANDINVLDMRDEFMFGNSMLVAPVTTPMYYNKDSEPIQGVRMTRNVYLPSFTQNVDGKAKKGTWYDFWTNEQIESGISLSADAPIDKMPLYVRSGSIIPMCADAIEYSDQVDKALWELRVYPGADAEFTIYEDSGDSYDYEKGKSSTVLVKWNDKTKTLTINARNGQYSPTPSRKFVVNVVGQNTVRTVTYSGKAVSVKM